MSSDTLTNPVEYFRRRVRKLIAGRKPEQLDLALDYLARWRLLQPQSFEALQRQTEIYLYRGQLEQASRQLQDWGGPAAQHPELKYFTGVLAQLQGDSVTARQYYADAIQQQRRDSNLMELDAAAMRVATAIQLCEIAAGNYPGSPAKSEAGMFGSAAALQQLEQALLHWEGGADKKITSEIRSIHANAWYNLGCSALADFTANDRRIELFRKALELDPDHLLARFNLAFSYNYSFDVDPGQIFAAHRESGQWLEQQFESSSLGRRANMPAERLRLGYLSSDFRQHSVAHFILPVLQQHDRNRFEIFVYHNHPREDALSQKARLFAEHFENVARFTDEQLLQRIRADQVDVLIDLNGLSEHHRLAVLAQRAAPLQIHWIGYPNTTGLTQVDCRIIDRLTDPPGQTEPYCTESLIRLAEPFLTFVEPADLPALTLPPCLKKNGCITLGSFNSLPKLNPPLLRSWAGIMQQIPESRLLIKNFGMDFDAPRNRIRDIFALEGIGGERLIFAGKTAAQIDHLRFYELVDISLDTFPYNGTTTTCDSLVMGVPVVSRVGEEHRSRVGLSLLSALGLESFAASDENSLREIVTALAANPQQLRSLRAELRSRLMQSRLGNATRLTADLEHELILARAHWQAKAQETHE
jgi:predicted O-linked N-acetylglucosamine transferase (SPINDLY family)